MALMAGAWRSPYSFANLVITPVDETSDPKRAYRGSSPSARMVFTPLRITSTRCLSHCPTSLPFLATGLLTSSTRSTTPLSLAAASLVPHFILLSSLWHALSNLCRSQVQGFRFLCQHLWFLQAATATSPEGRASSVMDQWLAPPSRMNSASSHALLRVCDPSTLSLIPSLISISLSSACMAYDNVIKYPCIVPPVRTEKRPGSASSMVSNRTSGSTLNCL